MHITSIETLIYITSIETIFFSITWYQFSQCDSLAFNGWTAHQSTFLITYFLLWRRDSWARCWRCFDYACWKCVSVNRSCQCCRITEICDAPLHHSRSAGSDLRHMEMGSASTDIRTSRSACRWWCRCYTTIWYLATTSWIAAFMWAFYTHHALYTNFHSILISIMYQFPLCTNFHSVPSGVQMQEITDFNKGQESRIASSIRSLHSSLFSASPRQRTASAIICPPWCVQFVSQFGCNWNYEVSNIEKSYLIYTGHPCGVIVSIGRRCPLVSL